MTLNTAALEKATTEQNALLQGLCEQYYTDDGDTVLVVSDKDGHAALAHQLAITSRVLLRSRRTLAALRFLTSVDSTSYLPALYTR